MINVLFVCLGNICRSPIAEGVFKELVAQHGLADKISCDSAGTAGYHIGALPDRRMRMIADKNGITLTHQARQFTSEDFANFDYIMAMDESNYEDISRVGLQKAKSSPSNQQLFLYRLFDPERGAENIVPDPYYGETKDFIEVYEIVERSGQSFLDFLIKKHDLTVDQ